MKAFTGPVTILVVAIYCTNLSSAMPDFLAPIRSMLGRNKQQGSGSASSSPYSKPHLSSSKDPSPSHHAHSKPHFGGGGPQEGDPFNSNFGFGSPPSQSYAPQSSSGGGRGSPYGGSRPGSRIVRQQPGPSYRPSFGGGGGPPSFGGGGRPSPSFGRGPPSHSSSSGGRDHFPHPQGPPNSNSGPYKYSDDEQGGGEGPPSGPSSFSSGGGGPPSGGPPSGGPPSSSYFGGGGRPSGRPGSSSFGGGGSGPPSFSSQGPPSSSPYQGGGGPGPNSGPSGGRPYTPFSDSNSDGPPEDDRQQGAGFSGFGSFPGGGDEEYDSPPPRGGGGGGSGPRGPPQSSSPFGGFGSDDDDGPKPFNSQSSSSRPFDGPPSSGPPSGYSPGGPPSRGQGQDSSPFFASSPGGSNGGPPSSDYPEQFQEAPRGTRNPQIISSDAAGKYPPQLSDDDDQGPPQGFGSGGFEGGRPPFRVGGGGRIRGGPSYSPQSESSSDGPASWGPPGQSQSSPFGAEDSPQASPSYTPKRRYPAKVYGSSSSGGSSYPKPRPVSSGGYQASSQNAQYGQPIPMMSMSASSMSDNDHLPVRPRRQRKRYSAKIQGPLSQMSQPRMSMGQGIAVGDRITPLVSPKDPNYMAPSSLSPVSAPFEPDTAASGHGHEHGGHEGLSHNGDRILYHVGGHQGYGSYRFGYDTGKGYNRLFRFEEKDGKGYVKGKYGFYDKQGKLQVIKYEAHPKHGFHAERAQSHL